MARPKLPADEKLIKTSISIPPAQWRTLHAIGRQRDRSISAVICQFVDEALARRPREVERAMAEPVAV